MVMHVVLDHLLVAESIFSAAILSRYSSAITWSLSVPLIQQPRAPSFAVSGVVAWPVSVALT